MADSPKQSKQGCGRRSASYARGMDMIASLAVEELSPTGPASATKEHHPPVGQPPRNVAPKRSPPVDDDLPRRVERSLRLVGAGASIDDVAFRGDENTKQQAIHLRKVGPRKADPRKQGTAPKKARLDGDGGSGVLSRKDETVDAILQIMKRFVHPASKNKSVHLKLYTIAQIVESRLSRAGGHCLPISSGPALEQSVKAIVTQIYEAVSSRRSSGSPRQKRRRTDESLHTVRTTPAQRSPKKAELKHKRIQSCLIDIDARLDDYSPIRLHPAVEMANIRRVLPPHSGRVVLQYAAASLTPPGSPAPMGLSMGHERGRLIPPIPSGGLLGNTLSCVMEPGACLNALPTAAGSHRTSFHAKMAMNAGQQEAAGAVAVCSGKGQFGLCAERLQGALAQSAKTSLRTTVVPRDLRGGLARKTGLTKQTLPPRTGRGNGGKSGQAPMHPSQPVMPPLPPPRGRFFVSRFA